MDTARDFTVRLQDLLRREHRAMADFLVALADFDSQRLWVELGYASIFDFLVRELGLSKASASFRKKAAELIQRFPEVVDPLRDGRLCLSSVFEVAKVLTPENHDEVLPRFFQLGKREAKVVAAALRPDDAPVLRTTVTPVRTAATATAAAPVPRPAPVRPDPPTGSGEGRRGPDGCDTAPSPSVVCPAKPAHANSTPTPHQELPPATPPRPRESTSEPLTADLSRLGVTVSRRFLEKLQAARFALSHSHPGASVDEILEAGLDLLLERDARRKGLVEKPRSVPPASTRPDHVPAHVRRAVWKRDGGKCQWPVESGGICGSTLRLQLDHVIPRALGGPSTVDNLRVCCAFHNDLAARHVYGDDRMDRYTRGPGAREPVAMWSAGAA